MKYTLAYKKNQVNVSAFYNFFSFIVDILFVSVLVIKLSNGFTIPTFEFILAQVAGGLFGVSTFLIAFVNLRGKAGTAGALVET